MRFPVAALASFLCALMPALVRAEAPDPLRLVPATADAVVKVENPRGLYEAIYDHPAFQDLLKIEAVAAFYDTTKFRRLLQMIAYFEKELGHERLDLLERLTGGGVVAAAQFEAKAVLVVVAARDEDILKKALALGRKIINQELARQDVKAVIQSGTYRQLETFHLGKDVYAARAGSALFLSNKESVLHKALDLFLDQGKESLANLPSLVDAKNHLPERPLVWGTLNLETIRKSPDVKNTLNTLGLDPTTMFLIGGVVDIFKRAPYVVAGLARAGNDFQARIVMPRGREGMAPLAAMFLPEDDRGTLPMLQPPRVLSSTGYFLDLGKFWSERHKILTPEQAKNMDKFEAQTAKYLKGVSLGTLLQQAGKYHRIVVTTAASSPYKIKPTLGAGSFAVVLDMRDPAFGKSMETILRGAALVGGFQYGLKMVEEKHQGHTLVTYYFPEKGKFAGDDNNFRFNFSPCFTHVGNQFVISSTLELGKDLVDCLLKETSAGTSPATQRTHIYGTGVAANLRSSEDLFVGQAILDQALPAAQAKKQFGEVVRLVERLGQIHVETRYDPQEYRIDIRWHYDGK